MAYKSDIDDLRESPALDVWALLETEWGAHVSYHDPFVSEIRSLNAKNSPLDKKTLESADAVVITTHHNSTDYALIVEHASLVLDTRNGVKVKGAKNVVQL